MASASTSASTPAPAGSARVQIVCFSMDRVFQLSEYLRTLHQHLLLHGARLRDDHSWARIAVICRCSTPAIRAFYDAIAAQYAHVAFLFEDDEQAAAETAENGRDFAACLLQSLQLRADDAGADDRDACPFVLFNVDDAFYFDDVELSKAEAFFSQDADTTTLAAEEADAEADGHATATSARAWPFAFHIKLAPSIWRSHLTNQPMLPLPPMTSVLPRGTDAAALAMSATEADKLFLTFDPARGCLDWSYPWELSGSVYRRATVERVVRAIQDQFGREGISRPNHLELRGHEIVHGQWMTQQARSLRCACLPRAKMHVFAINQVQDVFDNRLYATDQLTAPTNDEGSELLATSTGDLSHLLRLYESKETLDETYYRRHRFSSVHIGALVLTSASSAQPRVRGSVDWTADHTPLVSVVMPVYNVEAFVEQALRSVLQQSYPQMEVIVIDDACTDASPAIIASVMATDARIKCVRNETNLGVAASLNRGFSLAQGTFVARMDADDIAFPDRIQRQIHYMLEHPHVDILGASILVGREEGEPMGDRQATDMVEVETAVYPTSPLATKWQLLFGCFVAHPTVMMHRRVLNTIVASSKELYSTGTAACEDYDLWLRCAYRYDLTIMSLGDVLLYHRKHAGNTSTASRAKQIAQTHATATAWFQRLLGDDVEADTLQPLVDQDGAFSVEQLSLAITALERLAARLCEGTARDIQRLGASSSLGAQDQELLRDEWAAEQRYVRGDAASRGGELAFRAMLVDPVAGSALWSAFAAEHPQLSRAAFEKLMSKRTDPNAPTSPSA